MAALAINTGLQPGTPGSTPEATAKDFESLLGGADTSDEGEAEEEGSDDSEAEAEEGEAEPEAEEEESAEEEAEEEGEEEPEGKFTVKVDGKPVKVTLDELTKGYSRQADYTKKSQALADARKVAESEFTAVQQERARYAQILVVAEQRLMQAALPERDWEKLRTEDPVTFAAEWAQHQRVRESHAIEYQKLKTEQARLAQVQQIDQQKHLAAHVEVEQGKLLAALPTWSDPKVAGAEKKALVEFGASLGFTQEELDGVFDHRAVLALYKAMQYDTLQKRRPEARKVIEQAKTKVLTPGSVSNQPKVSTARKQAEQRFLKSGRVSDAASVFEAFI